MGLATSGGGAVGAGKARLTSYLPQLIPRLPPAPAPPAPAPPAPAPAPPGALTCSNHRNGDRLFNDPLLGLRTRRTIPMTNQAPMTKPHWSFVLGH